MLRRAVKLIKMAKARCRLSLGVRPLSEVWGVDRGLPIHRSYLERFLQEFSADIVGHCLEFQEDAYTTRFGGSCVTKVDILHLDHSNPHATIVADLTAPNDVPSDWFDCIVCTHVYHMVFDVARLTAELYRILKPNGVLLVAVPHISMYGPQFHECWRFTPEGLSRVLARAFGEANVTIRSYGNSLTAAGELRGLVVDEFTPAELSSHDPRFAVEVCARALKTAGRMCSQSALTGQRRTFVG